jgi:hypothetical protein
VNRAAQSEAVWSTFDGSTSRTRPRLLTLSSRRSIAGLGAK